VTSSLRRGSLAVAAASALATAMVLGATAQTPSPQATPTPPVCARPNVGARTLRAVPAKTPPLAQQQNIVGTVLVIVSLDANSNVIGARIQSSPSPLLNNAALAAARQSTFQTEIRDCRPIAGDYVFTVDFESQPAPTTILNGKPAVVVSAVATARPAPDNAVVSLTVRGAPVTDPSQAQPPAELLAALRAKLAAAGIRASEIAESRTTSLAYPSSGPTAPPVPPPYLGFPAGGATTPAPASHFPLTYAVVTNLRITVNAIGTLPAVLAAVRETPGWYLGNVQYLLNDREPVYREALDRAVRDARGRAQVAARAAGMRLGSLARLDVDSPDYETSYVGTSPTPIAQAPATLPTLVVRARVTATYLIVP
jgi:TonB family protein